MKKITFAATLYSLLLAQPVWAMSTLSDEELSDTQGQALFNLSYLSPGDTSNYETTNNIGFYRLGVEAEIAANLNIKKLQLGCGGINGAGKCDIDIDNLSLSGNPTLTGIALTDSTNRVQSDAVLTNPFFEFAIKNPNTASTREVVGFRVSAEKALGLLTTGTENSTTPNGINTISGFMRVQSDSSGNIFGKANTDVKSFNAATYPVTGRLVALGGIGGEATFVTSGGGFNVPAMTGIPFTRSGKVINQSRVTSLPLTTTLNVPSINLGDSGSGFPAAGQVIGVPPSYVETLGGKLQATVLTTSGLASTLYNTGDVLPNVYMSGSIQNAKANVTINQSLGYIHSLPINSPFYLSVQQQDMRWPGTYSGPDPENPASTVTDIAKRGWWMSFADPINLGSVDPTQSIDIEPLFPQIASAVSTWLAANPATSNDLGGLLGIGALDVDVGTVNLGAFPLSLTLTDLQLNGQNFAPNCYGGLKFC